ncbi:hypothetical protein DFA_03088 [Cavenderia fasciculata]|uniref:Uncharacterized protein n=1 Tax=Cavenderia fasciculata TaxID=261658 RepID=F4PGK9_CACFS|nr:uncharacterized protein DFA_03088 [Cavenderia fasciculata]EGG24843.1 hypothetical protein DFA_03088 [Cavenderia fasciculata]|eukprot:XP_004362694.1 hypothetical protein DFA_03088 [Cavenderia fasciculata]
MTEVHPNRTILFVQFIKLIGIFFIVSIVSNNIIFINAQVPTFKYSYPVAESEVASIDYLIKQYVMYAKVENNTLYSNVSRLFLVKNLNVVEINSPTNDPIPPWLDSGRPDMTVTSLNFTKLEYLFLYRYPRDGSNNILELTRGMPSLIEIQVNELITTIPEGFPFTKKLQKIMFNSMITLPKNLNNEVYPSLTRYEISSHKEPMPDGFGDRLFASFIMNLQGYLPFRLPDSLVTANSLTLKPISSNPEYIAQAYQCFNGTFMLSESYQGGFIKDFPNNICNISVTSLRYNGNKVTIRGNNIMRGQNQYGTNIRYAGGTLNQLVPGSMLEFTRNTPGMMEEFVPIANHSQKNLLLSIAVSFTRINLGHSKVITQVPFGVVVTVDINYNTNIEHRLSLNGATCKLGSLKLYNEPYKQ